MATWNRPGKKHPIASNPQQVQLCGVSSWPGDGPNAKLWTYLSLVIGDGEDTTRARLTLTKEDRIQLRKVLDIWDEAEAEDQAFKRAGL